MSKEKYTIPPEGLYDARKLGIPKMILLGLQHTFAMFGLRCWCPSSQGSTFLPHF